MISLSVLFRSPNTIGPIELYIKHQLMKRISPGSEKRLVDEIFYQLFDEEGRTLLDIE